jgi:hypothetical protein
MCQGQEVHHCQQAGSEVNGQTSCQGSVADLRCVQGIWASGASKQLQLRPAATLGRVLLKM